VNLPNSVTPRDIDNIFQADDSTPNREECFLCKRMIQQSPDFGLWFIEDGSGWVPTHYSDFTDAVLTEQGWLCSVACWNENVALNEDESVPAPKLFLVGAR
jgi:hypothetical protein